ILPHLDDHYHALGTPAPRLQRRLTPDLERPPYASSRPLITARARPSAHLQRLQAEGAEGKYGFYEAGDDTPSRVPRGQTRAIVRAYMAHHQGMSLLGLSHVLLDRPMQRRFEAVPIFQATTLLLQEKVPKATAIYSAP